MKKYRKIITVLLIVLVLVYIYQKFPKNYQKEYKINKFNVQEKYIKKTKTYYFVINDKFEYAYKTRYRGKKLIKDISYVKKNDKCVNIKGRKIDFYPLCQASSYQANDIKPNKNIDETNTKYKDIEINTILNENIYIWSHTGYYHLNKDDNEKINLFKNEYYYNDSAFVSGRYLITPDYAEKNEYKHIFVIDMKKGKTKSIELDTKINYNSYYLGTHKNKTYIVDRKNKNEYELNIKKESIKSVLDSNQNGKYYDDGFKNISITKLSHNDYTFNYPEYYHYKIKGKKLYLNYFNSNNDILIVNHKVDKIISYNDKFVYYLYKNKVYSWSYEYGELLLFTFNELEFNNNNQVFIY